MQTARKVKYDFSTDVIKLKLTTIERNEEKALKNDDKNNKACFQTDERYFCKDKECACASECKKLIAVWLR